MSHAATSLPPDERTPRSEDPWVGGAANHPHGATDPGNGFSNASAQRGDSAAVLALTTEVRALREQLADLTKILDPNPIARGLDRFADRLAHGVAHRVCSSLDERVPSSAAQPDPTAAPRRWGSVEEAAAVLGVSRDTIDRMRREQRREGWTLPGDPVQIGTGASAGTSTAWVSGQRRSERNAQRRSPREPVARPDDGPPPRAPARRPAASTPAPRPRSRRSTEVASPVRLS